MKNKFRNLVKKVAKKVARKGFLIAAACLAALSVSAQTVSPAKYTWVDIPFPVTAAAGVGGTNLMNGWTNTTTTTNITSLWNVNSNAFVNTTNITTNASLTYANFQALGQRNVALQFVFNSNSNALTSTKTFFIGFSVDGVNYDTANWKPVAFPYNNTTNVVGTTNIAMDGFGYGRIMVETNGGPAALATQTNVSWRQSIKQQAP